MKKMDEKMRKEKDVCDKCDRKDVMCVSFRPEPYVYEITLCKSCLEELLGYLK